MLGARRFSILQRALARENDPRITPMIASYDIWFSLEHLRNLRNLRRWIPLSQLASMIDPTRLGKFHERIGVWRARSAPQTPILSL